MKNIILTLILTALSFTAYSAPYLSFSTQEMDAITSQGGFQEKETLYGFTIGGLNIDEKSVTHYLRPSWEVSIDFSENAFDDLHEKRYTQIILTNLAINIPINQDSFFKFGVGVLRSNIVLSNSEKQEEEAIFNVRIGGGYRIFKRFLVGSHFDTATKSPSIQLGYLF